MHRLIRMLVIIGAIIFVVTLGSASIGFAGSSNQPSEISRASMVIGGHTIQIIGHYKSVAPDAMPDGIKLLVDNQTITAHGDQVTINGHVQNIPEGQDMEIWIDERGGIEPKIISRGQIKTIKADATTVPQL